MVAKALKSVENLLVSLLALSGRTLWKLVSKYQDIVAAMKILRCFSLVGLTCLLILHSFTETCGAAVMNIGQIPLGFQGSQANFIDNNGLFLKSSNSIYGFGFSPTNTQTSFLLVIIHISSSTIIWTANRRSPVENSGKFVFEANGTVYLENEGKRIWSLPTEGKEVSSLELRDSGNLVLVGKDRTTAIWESFSYPTDTLLSNQSFYKGMRLLSSPNFNDLSYFLEFQSGDLILYASFQIPQPYWSIRKDRRLIINKVGGDVYSAVLTSNSWDFYDQNQTLLWKLILSGFYIENPSWAAVLGSNGVISLVNLLHNGRASYEEMARIPDGSCNAPDSCNPYYVCSKNKPCFCPSALSSNPSCKLEDLSSCNSSKTSMEVLNVGDRLDYFALEFVSPFSTSDLEGCKEACLRNCSCRVLFFEMNAKNCFLFDEIGSLRESNKSSNEFLSYIKVPIDKLSSSSQKHFPLFVIIIVASVLAGAGILYLGFNCYWSKKRLSPPRQDSSEEDVLESLPGMPVRFRYQELETATNNFSMKLGQGGFGSVYRGTLKDGTQVAVKKLESIGQGRKEFRAEVRIIGTIRHSHLVRIKGFCEEGGHHLLVYEYMEKGSLDKCIFMKNNQDFLLNWDTRFDIALGTAKGLAYLHEDCEVRIIHCDIKPGNVLLDSNYQAKLSDFGMAKLMTKEQSRAFTTLRGTRGYLAPEWIMNYAISEKSDVYSYGILLLEIIGGRKILDPLENSEKAYFPRYVFNMMEEGKIKEIIDPTLDVNPEDERVVTAIKVALWCIQENMQARPSMSKVVQMLEGVIDIPKLPHPYQAGFQIYSCFFKSSNSNDRLVTTGEDYRTSAFLSANQLSGPR